MKGNTQAQWSEVMNYFRTEDRRLLNDPEYQAVKLRAELQTEERILRDALAGKNRLGALGQQLLKRSIERKQATLERRPSPNAAVEWS